MVNKRAAGATLAVVLGAGMLLAACGGKAPGNASEGNNAPSGGTTGNDSNEVVELDFWTFWGSEQRRPVIEKLIDDFNKSQNRIRVKHTYYPFGDIWTKELAAVAAGNPPDVIINDINSTAIRAEKKQNVNLQEFLAKDQSIKDRFYPELWNTVLYKGEAYALPFNTDTRMMFYNKTLFKEAGLDPEKFPNTWAELEEAAKKLDKKSGDKYTVIGYSPQYGGFDWGSIAMNFDGGRNWFDENGKPVVNAPAKLEAMEYVIANADRIGQKNLDAFKAEFGSKQANPFIAGKVAIWPNNTTFYTEIRDYGQGLDFGIAPIPEKTPGSGHWSIGGGFVIEIPAGAKHPAESFEFMKYMTDVAAQKYWAEKNFDNVANIKAAEDPELAKNPIYKAAVDNMKWTKVFPTPLNAPDFQKLIDPQRDAAILKKTPAKEALDKAQADVENLIKQNTK